ncbi:hypothetical protein RRG08_005520 [Elysia crispata]|uniref:Major facilitator superfamily (MFS) profile domain-containing protein n=1 Tax=Elysia crispata TaxID=231223 RepID=A0AAE0XR39_9GAST|nr:hypothetical protein RRG08_005520 [Elysia crispata]
MVIRDEDYGEEDPDMLEEVLTGRLNRFETDADPLDFGPDEYISQYIAQPEIVKNDCNKAEVTDILDQEPGLPPNLNPKQKIGDTNAEDKFQESKHFEQHLKAPDGGYGWFIVLGSFVGHILSGGIGRSDGLFFLMFESRFNQSATLTAWPGALAGMLRLAMGPIASAICQCWSVRACCLLGGLALGIVHILTAFSPNFFAVLFSHGFLQGIAMGLTYAPSLILINKYFDSRRSFATGIASSGSGIGTFLLVPVIQFLFDIYGFTSGFLMLGALCLHAVLMAMLFRPLFLHYKFMGRKRYVKEKSNPAELVMLSGMKDASKTSSYRSESLQNTISVCEKYTGEDQEASQKLMQHKLPDNIPTQDLLHRKVSSSAFSPKAMKDGFWKSTVDILFPRDGQCRKLGDSNRKKTKLFHFGLLRNSAFLGFCLSLGAFIAASKSVFIFLPALAKSGGLTTSEAVLILSFSGAVDTVGRIVSGYLLDRSSLRKRRLVVYCCILFLLAVVCASMPVLGGDFLWLCVTSSLFGMLTGVLASQKSVICVDLLGSERMPSAFGILLLFQALGKGIGPLLFGLCRDEFGTFHEAFFLGAGLMAASACLMLYSALVHSMGKRRDKERQASSC